MAKKCKKCKVPLEGFMSRWIASKIFGIKPSTQEVDLCNKCEAKLGNTIYRNYAVAFIDVLGQKELFKNFNSSFLKDNDPRLIEIHKQTVQFIEHLRTWFESFFESFSKPSGLESSVPKSKRKQFLEMHKSRIKTYRFSDSVLAFTSLQTEKYHSVAIGSVYGILMACGAMMIMSLVLKKAFRASIDVGIGTNLSNGEVYGPVSYKVYELESKIAQYPRIVIGDELCSYLLSLSKGIKQFPKQEDIDIKLCKILADVCLKMIIKDSDGQVILDYLGSNFKSNFGNVQLEGKMTQEELIEKAFQFVEEELAKRKKMADIKLVQRYQLLYNYFKTKQKAI